MYLQELLEIIKNNEKSDPFICIEDLVKNGLSLDRFLDDSQERPSRHEITLFIAAWCRFVGLESEMYREWLINYCVDVLGEISSSATSQIRHSTKSTINYIHRSKVPFVCGCENNIFQADCSSNCQIYDEMKMIHEQNLENEKKRVAEYSKEPEVIEPDPESLPVTKRYAKPFLEATGIIEERLKNGDSKKDIAAFLHAKGYKTTTGREWKPNIVTNLAIAKGWAPKRKKQKKTEKK